MIFSFGCAILTYHPLVRIMEKLLTTPTRILPDTTKLNDVLQKCADALILNRPQVQTSPSSK